MMGRRVRLVVLLATAVLLVACGGTADPAAAPVTPLPLPTDTPTPPPPPANATAAAFTSGGQNDNGTFFRGDAAAPVTLIDYSDFL